MIIRSRAPVRISFAGGGTDVSPYPERFGGCALNAAIRRYAWATLEMIGGSDIVLESHDFRERLNFRSRDEIQYDGHLDLLKAVVHHYTHVQGGFRLFLRTDFPPRSGLGGSAAAFIAVIAVFDHLLREERQSRYELAELAFKLEREVLKVAGGRQDQYAAVFGGVNFLEFKGQDFVRVNPLRLPVDTLLELEKHTVLIQLPPARAESTHIIQEQTQRVESGEAGTLTALHRTKDIAQDMKRALLRADVPGFARLLDEAWVAKKQFTPHISNPSIDRLYSVAKAAGAIGGKITGAGGGGHMMFVCQANREQEVMEALEREGAKPVDCYFDTEGVQVWEAEY